MIDRIVITWQNSLIEISRQSENLFMVEQKYGTNPVQRLYVPWQCVNELITALRSLVKLDDGQGA